MMNIQQKRDLLMSLPLMEQEQRWIMERLDTLSVKEQYQLSAAILRTGKLEELAGKTGWELETAILHMDPEVAVDAVNCLLSLEDYQICFPAGSYAQLGSFYLRHESHLPERAMYYADLEALGRRYEDRHPGLFVGNCYVEYPEHPSAPRCTGQGLIPEDDGWSMKVKLASSAVPEGVWLRLPDYSAMTDRPDEVALALDELKTRSLENCMLLDGRCSLPELGNLMEQYDSALELVNDGSDLGYVLDEQGQGMPHFMERFAAALEFEHCRDLRLALDISQNLHCYEWVPHNGLKDFGRRKLLEAGVSEELLDSGCIDLEGYGADLLEEAGYRDPRWRVQNPGDHSLGIQTTGMARETGRLPEYNLKEKCCHERRKHCHFLAGGALLTGPAHPGECTHLRDPYLRPGPGGSLRQSERLFHHPGPEGGGRGERALHFHAGLLHRRRIPGRLLPQREGVPPAVPSGSAGRL